MHVDIKEEPQFNEDFDIDFDQSECHITQLEMSCRKKRQKKFQPRNWLGEQGMSEGSE